MRRVVRATTAVAVACVFVALAGGTVAAADPTPDSGPTRAQSVGPVGSIGAAGSGLANGAGATAAEGDGNVTIDVRHDGLIPWTDGDRATEVTALVVYQDGDTSEAFRTITDRTWERGEERLVDVPRRIELPAGHDYRVSVYVTDQFAGETEWITLEEGESVDRTVTVENYVAIRPEVFYSDGSTPVKNATVRIRSHGRAQSGDAADPVVWRSAKTDYRGVVDVANGEGKVYLYPTDADDGGSYLVEVSEDGETIAERTVDDLTADRTERIRTGEPYSVTVIGYDPQTGAYHNTTITSFDWTSDASSASLPDGTALSEYAPPGTDYGRRNVSAVDGRTAEYPWSAVGALGVAGPSLGDRSTPTCTATVVEDNHVVTAAHCVYSGGGWGFQFEPGNDAYPVFAPGANPSASPFGAYNVTFVQFYDRWAEWGDASTAYDVAVLTLNESVGSRTGTFGYEGNPADSDRYVGPLHVTGYPSQYQASYASTEFEQWDIVADGEDTDAYAIPECRDLCHDYATGSFFDETTVGGTSGSSVWTPGENDLPSAVSIHHGLAGAFLDYTDALSDGVGARITERKQSDIGRMIHRGNNLSVSVTPTSVDVGSDAVLSVTVTRHGGRAVEDATVALSGVADLEGTTDANGFVAFAVEPATSGYVTVTARTPGSENATATVVVGDGATPTASDVRVSTPPGESVTGAFEATGYGSLTPTYAVTSGPAHGTVSASGDRFTYAPESGFTGVDSFTYRVSTGGNRTDTATAYVAVRSEGSAVIDGVVTDRNGDPVSGATVRVPLSGADRTTTTDGRGAFSLDLSDDEHPSEVTVFVESTGFQTASRIVDPSESSLLSVALTPTSESVVQLSDTLHHLGDGSYSGTINSQFQEPVEGSSFTTEFSLTRAQADAESVELVYTARGIELDNGIYLNGGYVGTTAETAADGSLSERRLSVSPTDLEAGENRLTIRAAENWYGDLDDFELSSVRLRISTAAADQPPTARNVSVRTEAGAEATGAFNATDPNADIQSYAVETAPAHGTVTAAGGTFVYAPDAGYAGSDSFTYVVRDDDGNSDTATVEVTVESVGGLNRASPSEVSPGETATVTLEVAVSDSKVSVVESFDPGVASATVERVTVDGVSAATLVEQADPDGVVVTLADGAVPPNATVVVEYVITVPEGVAPGTTYALSGNVTAAETTSLGTDRLTVVEGNPLEGAAGEYDADVDGRISVGELGDAAADYARGSLTVVELGEVAAAYAKS